MREKNYKQQDNVRGGTIPTHPGFYRENIAGITARVNSTLGAVTNFSRQNRNGGGMYTTFNYKVTREKLKPILKDGFNIEIATLTDTEVNDISILFHFFLKRGIHSQIQFNGLNKGQEKAEIPKRIDKKSITWHDLAHCAARYMLDPENKGSDPGRFTPTPLKYKYNGYAEDFGALSEELYATLWMGSGTGRGKQLFVLRVLRESKPESIDSFYEAYIQGCLKFNEFRVGETFSDVYVRAFTLDFYKLPSYRQRAASVMPLRERIRNEKFPKLRELLGYILDHQNDPRVLFDLFYKEMRPLIERLKGRAEYC